MTVHMFLASSTSGLQSAASPPKVLLQVHLHDDKAVPFLEESSRVFESILDAEDQRDGEGIEHIMEQLQSAEGSPIVKHLVQQLFLGRQ